MAYQTTNFVPFYVYFLVIHTILCWNECVRLFTNLNAKTTILTKIQPCTPSYSIQAVHLVGPIMMNDELTSSWRLVINTMTQLLVFIYMVLVLNCYPMYDLFFYPHNLHSLIISELNCFRAMGLFTSYRGGGTCFFYHCSVSLLQKENILRGNWKCWRQLILWPTLCYYCDLSVIT